MVALATAMSACAHSAAMRAGREAEKLDDFDRAVVEYTKAVREDPSKKDARLALDRAKLRAAAAHYQRGRRLAANNRFEEALLEYQLAAELNPTDPDVEHELTATRTRCVRRLRSRIRGGLRSKR